MSVIAAILADLETSTIGTRSRLAGELVGVQVLRATVERVARAERIDAVHVLCPQDQLERCGAILEDTPSALHAVNAGPSPWQPVTRCARKWSLDGWRGGIGGSTCFDEYTDCRLLEGLLKAVRADWVLSVPSAGPLFDPGLADAMIERRLAAGDDVQLAFTQAPPGLAGVLLDAALVRELAEKNVPLGWLFSYQPDNPRKDLLFQSSCHEVPALLRYSTGRLIADTDRSMQRLADLLHTHRAPDLETTGRWLINRDAMHTEPLPREIEIELTTDDPFPDALLRPRGERVGRRGPINTELVTRVVTELAGFDDALVVLGGFGDPLRHPLFCEILAAIRSHERNGRRLYGLAVRTAGIDLTDELIEAMIVAEVDVLNVVLDAWSPELYTALNAPVRMAETAVSRNSAPAVTSRTAPNLHSVVESIDRVARIRERRGSAAPIVVPEMTKARENVHELNAFYDGWIRRVGAATIAGHSHFAGQCMDRGVIHMAPPSRYPCRRLAQRCLVLADGRVAVCDQDFGGLHTVGSLHEHSLEEVWLGPEFERIRESHRAGRFDPTPLCTACEEWHRP